MKSSPFVIIHASESTDCHSLAQETKTKRHKRPYKKIENAKRMELLKLVSPMFDS